MKPIFVSKNMVPVYLAPNAHPHRTDLYDEISNLITIPNDTTFIFTTIDLGHKIGLDHCVKTDSTDEIVYFTRGNRPGKTRFTMNRTAPQTSLVTLGLCRDRDPGQTQGFWFLFTLFEGAKAPKEPWDKNFLNEKEKEESEAFWANHALVPTGEERAAIMASL